MMKRCCECNDDIEFDDLSVCYSCFEKQGEFFQRVILSYHFLLTAIIVFMILMG